MTNSSQSDTPLKVSSDLHFSGQANTGGVVHSGACLYLSGQMNGRLIVEEGASAHLSGQLNGPVEVAGVVDVTGMLSGEPDVTESGRLTFATGACLVRAGRTLVVSDMGEFQPMPSGGATYVVSGDTPRWIYQQDGTLLPAK